MLNYALLSVMVIKLIKLPHRYCFVFPAIANSNSRLINYYFCNYVFDLSTRYRYLFHTVHDIYILYICPLVKANN